MATAAEELSQNIRDQFLQCKICLDGLKTPKTLPCLHTFCEECLIYYIDHNRIDDRKFSCPICRRHIYIPKNGVFGFPDSFFVESLHDVIQQSATKDAVKSNECGICRFKEGNVTATVMCVDCKIELCEECSSAHIAAKITEGHTLLPLGGSIGSVSRENYCRVHRGETVKYYCEQCNSPICLPCTFLDHKGHQIEEIKNVRQTFAADVSGLVLQSEDNILQLVSARDDMEELENELFVRREAIKTDIRRTIQELIRTINDQEAVLMNDVDGFYDTLALAQDRQKVERTIFRLQRAHEFAKQLLSTDTSPITQLVNRSEAKENLNTALEYELPDITVHSAKMDRHVYLLPGRLDVWLGSLLKCTTPEQPRTVGSLRHTLPSTKAMYCHTLRIGDATSIGEVIAVGFLPNADVAVLISEGRKVKIFSARGKLRYEFGEDEELQHPSDLAITHEGDIAVADCGLRAIKIFDHLGTLLQTIGDETIFGLPSALTVDELGRILVCDQAKERLTIHRQNGELLSESSLSAVKCPQYVSSTGNKVFVCDSDHNMVSVYTCAKDGLQPVAVFSSPADAPSHFLASSGIACDRYGSLFITDNVLDRVHVINIKGEISSLSASGRAFSRPACIATSQDGLLAVAQRGPQLDTEAPTHCDVAIYRMVRCDI